MTSLFGTEQTLLLFLHGVAFLGAVLDVIVVDIDSVRIAFLARVQRKHVVSGPLEVDAELGLLAVFLHGHAVAAVLVGLANQMIGQFERVVHA